MSEGEKKPENLVPVYKKNFIVSLYKFLRKELLKQLKSKGLSIYTEKESHFCVRKKARIPQFTIGKTIHLCYNVDK